MKFILQIIALLIAFLAGAIWENQAYAQTTYIYGPQGQNAGSAVKSGNTTYFYGAQGQNVGTATTSDNTTYVYGSQGQNIGTMTNLTPVFVVPSYAPNPTSLTPMYDSIFNK